MSRIDEVYKALIELETESNEYVSAARLSEYMNLDRANVSRYLNQLFKNNKIEKIDGRPVLYHSLKDKKEEEKKTDIGNSLDRMIGAEASLKIAIQQAKAAIFYPPKGLHTLILGETGVGKSMFAELMYQFAKESGMIDKNAPFIRFNCADYADNPQLVVGQIFGVRKGAYTGAENDKEGLLKKANGGILFLDEIHRLSPQGQEMLFTYIDKGYFRQLGDTENLIKVQAQIIAATTEDPQSYLLKTFTRRVPMIVTLPALRDRTIKERYHLLQQFITMESKRLEKNIYIDKNALISFLLYDCPNNIGQLKSDIQLSCAKAFLDYKTKNLDYVFIEQIDLPKSVKKGLMKIQQYREEVNDLLNEKRDILIFYYDNNIEYNFLEESDECDKDNYFYDLIEKKFVTLKNQGIDEKDINDILNIDIESHFEKYMSHLPQNFRKEEITKVVGKDIINVVDKILNLANKKLNREFDEKIYFGLSLHLQRSIERIRQGSSIYHPKLNFIRSQYANEFMVAIEVAKIIDNEFNIETPLDEIGYLTMFLASNQYENNINSEKRVGILVIMHGKSTASSMVQVSNELLGEACAKAIDMPLSMKAEEVYEIAKIKARELDVDKGVLLLVDMGSLNNFGPMISEETGVEIKTIDMASTPVVIEACRKSLLGRDLEYIYNSCKELSRLGIQVKVKDKNVRKFLIITACFTGEGAAERLKDIISNSLNIDSKLDIVPLNILDKNDFLSNVEKLSNNYKIIAVVGTINIFIKDVPFISAAEILSGDGINLLKELVNIEENFYKIRNSIQNHINLKDSDRLVDLIRGTIEVTEKELNINLPNDVKIGMILHISFMIDKLKDGGVENNFENLKDYISKYKNEFEIINKCFKQLEKIYDVIIGNSEKAYILRMFIENSVIV
ncbi:sigma 54-interacting transcriptional regulator [Clostridium sp. MB40-C1]|uniref:sigma 54-interacting transcriptional regulator n=1 Tax=Clostridium sp. MB40-C1 TaxID=3070996 RepID=UPI0027DFF67D|nr:sigma-54-dependent transcriptional regulator [Clostridium sp. MB40-C1]WMJ81739.1 sigma 54-interacting transcriptional regulator [Clostridium sp. MB40-C1]